MSGTKKASIFRQKLELLIIDGAEAVLNRAKQTISRHYLTFQNLNFKDIPSGPLGELIRAQLILLSQNDGEDLASFSLKVESILKQFPRSRVVTVLQPGFNWNKQENWLSSRVTVLSQAEFFNTLKFDYLCLYRCRGQYQEIQPNDLFPMTTMSFPAFIRLSLNERYLAVVFSKTILSDERFQRLAAAEGLYIQNKDADKYLEYIKNFFDTSGKGMQKRARAAFLCVYHYSLLLNESLLFDHAPINEKLISEIFTDLKIAADELFNTFRSEENLWDNFREASADDFAALWRSPWIGVYAALMSIKSGTGDPMVALLSALFCDLGIYDLEEAVALDHYTSAERKISDIHQKSYEKHSILSLNRALIKKLPLDEAVKSVLVCIHERADEKGFPNQVPTHQLPVEAQLVAFAEKIDQAVLTTMKNTGVGFKFQREKVLESENANPGQFSSEFLSKISNSIL